MTFLGEEGMAPYGMEKEEKRFKERAKKIEKDQ